MLEPLEVLEDQNQIEDIKENEAIKEQRIDNATYNVPNISTNAASISSALSNYRYTKKDIDNFFASENG